MGCGYDAPPTVSVETGVEQLCEEVDERLTEAEDFDLEGRPFHEIVAGVCKDLGMSPDWTARLTDAAGATDAAPQPIFPRAVSRGGSPREAGDGGFGAISPAEEAQSPLHHASRGPPPPTFRAGGGFSEPRPPP